MPGITPKFTRHGPLYIYIYIHIFFKQIAPRSNELLIVDHDKCAMFQHLGLM